MKESESSFDVQASVKELQVLVGSRIENVYHPSLDHLVLAVKSAQREKCFIHFIIGRWLYISDKSREMPQQPSDFAMMLRKRIVNARIAGIRQQGFDRIAVLSLEKEDKFELVLELFGDGNVILVKDDAIVQPLTSHTWKHRDVRAKKPFMFPPPVPDPALMGPDDLLQLVHSSDTDLVRTIATKLNTGGRYSEELCLRAGLSKKMPAKEADGEMSGRILEALREFRSQIASARLGYIVVKEGTVEDVVPVMMLLYSDLAHEEYESYSSALESYIPRIPKPRRQEPKEDVLENERLLRKLAQQRAAAVRLQDEAREEQLKGDALFAMYQEANKLLTAAKRNLDEGRGMTEIQGFISYDQKTGKLRVALGEDRIELNVRASLEGNAKEHYEAAKRARKKLEGVLRAAEEAEEEIEDIRSKATKAETGQRKKHEPTKKFWFERFRWFVSSEGAVVLGGKDAKSNDMLVKKHLEPGDRYAHADIHGAPSVVVKMREGVTEKTLHEACEFAVATSKAWNAKIGSAAGYWVLPEQVSKTPQSGEYLPKGAFVIRGKRNYSDKLAIQLGVGEIEHEGARKIMCGPVSAIRSRAKRFVIIRPGERDKNDFAKLLSDILEVPIEEVQSILPPGDVDIVESAGMVISL